MPHYMTLKDRLTLLFKRCFYRKLKLLLVSFRVTLKDPESVAYGP